LAQPAVSVNQAVSETGAYLLKTVTEPQVGSIGGEWAVIALARCGYEVPQSWYSSYYNTLCTYVINKNGILHDKKYTEYSRVILALTAIGQNPANVGGYNLLEKLGDYNKVVWQGINGPSFALIALDSGNYDVPKYAEAEVQTTRDLLITAIISQQLADGGFALSGTSADPDITAMALQALAPYQDRTDVKTATVKALTCLSALQKIDGGFASYGEEASESTVQVLVALTALGINPQADSRFIKDGNWLISNLMTYYVEGGGFKHTSNDTTPNGMTTEQALYGLAAYQRFVEGANRLYDMGDATDLVTEDSSTDSTGLSGKNTAVKVSFVIYPDKNFDDIKGNEGETEILALAERGIVNGISDTLFEPDRTMTRAEFAAIMVKALGLSTEKTDRFDDVKPDAWYNGYIGSAYDYGIIKGQAATVFNPGGTLTNEEAAVMLTRAAKLCGYDTAMTSRETLDMLAQFDDYVDSSAWSRESLAFCLQEAFISQDQLLLNPKAKITRAEVAVMLYRMLDGAELLAE